MATYRKTWRAVRVSMVRTAAPWPYAMRSPRDVVGLLDAVLEDDPRERFVAAYLDARYHVIAVHIVSIGTADEASVHPREVYGPAVSLGACAVICAHNHPSGDPVPSERDELVTHRLREAGEILGIELLDHLVIAHGGRVHSIVSGDLPPITRREPHR